MTEHAATPWRYELVSEFTEEGEINKDFFIIISESTKLKRVVAELDIWPEHEANAAFIVRACNWFDEGMEALQDLVADYEELGGEAFFADTYKKAQAVLAKAQEE
jgi:hypothetical protein